MDVSGHTEQPLSPQTEFEMFVVLTKERNCAAKEGREGTQKTEMSFAIQAQKAQFTNRKKLF